MTKYLLSAVVILLFAAGCDASKYPIDDRPLIKADSRLEGSWRPIRKDTGTVYVVKQKNDYEYSITIKGKDWDKTRLNAFLSNVDDARFLNIYDNKDSGYLLLRIFDLDNSAGLITVAMVQDSTIGYLNGPVEVRTRIGNNLNNPAYYTDTIQMRKEK